MPMFRVLVRCAVVMLVPLLSGCVLVAAGAGVAGISAARQERTIGNAVDDARIKTTLDTRLAKESPGLYLRVATTVVEGRVLLTGRVDVPENRLAASRVAWSVEGVRKVDNDIEVSDISGWLDGPADLIMRTELATALLADKGVKDVNYTTDVVHGVVYLMGIAQNKEELDRVIAHAQKLNGVRRVENYVVLKDDPIRYNLPAVSDQPVLNP